MNKIVSDIFSSFQEYVSSEQDLREEIRSITKDIEKLSREMAILLQIIHSEKDQSIVLSNISKAREHYDGVREGYKKLAALVPHEQYYRFNDHWRVVTQRLCFLSALIIFLEVGTLISRDTAAEMLGVSSNQKDGFHLDLEDYLIGLLQLSSELSRYAVNCVTMGDYLDKPFAISRFLMELNAGFRLLNLKNDNLRKKFDALKYDVKKVEEVVYDLSVRGLKTNDQ